MSLSGGLFYTFWKSEIPRTEMKNVHHNILNILFILSLFVSKQFLQKRTSLSRNEFSDTNSAHWIRTPLPESEPYTIELKLLIS